MEEVLNIIIFKATTKKIINYTQSQRSLSVDVIILRCECCDTSGFQSRKNARYTRTTLHWLPSLDPHSSGSTCHLIEIQTQFT